MSIRLRLTLWYSGIVALTLLVFGTVLYFSLHYYIYNDYKDRIKRQADAIAIKGVVNIFDQLDLYIDQNSLQYLNDEFFVQIYNYTNYDLKTSSNLRKLQLTLPFPKKLQVDQQAYFNKENIGSIPFMVYTQPLKALVQGKEAVIGVLQVAAYTGREDRFFEMLVNVLILTGALTILIAFSLGLLLVRKALQPIDSVIAAARQIEKGADLDNRILYDGPNDEIGQLVRTLNGMLSRIETVYNELDDAYTAQRRFVSDASHELRTPLTTIRGNVDLLEKMWANAAAQIDMSDESKKEMSLEAMRDIADEARRMSRLVNDMLSLARADAGQTMEKVPVELKPLVEEVVRRAQFLPRKADWITGDLSALDGVTVQGNKDYLQQLLFIFIENGFKYTPQGYVKLDALMRGGQIGIRISDTGIGMDKGEVPHIFERFYRADVSRGVTAGTGLGLSIAKWIIDEHGGSIEVMTRKDEGSIFVIWLPVGFQLNAP